MSESSINPLIPLIFSLAVAVIWVAAVFVITCHGSGDPNKAIAEAARKLTAQALVDAGQVKHVYRETVKRVVKKDGAIEVYLTVRTDPNSPASEVVATLVPAKYHLISVYPTQEHMPRNPTGHP
jgi:hypothetical protein